MAMAETERASDATSRESLAELRHLHAACDKLLTAAAEASRASKDALATMAAANMAHSALIVKAVTDASTAARTAARTAALQWAYDRATVGEFAYAGQPLTPNNYQSHDTSKSGAFCAKAILSFKMDNGTYADGYIFHDTQRSKPFGERNTLASTAFRTAVIAQLHALIGMKPYEKLQDDGRYAIFLS